MLRTLCLRCMKAPDALVQATQRVADELEGGGMDGDGFTTGDGMEGFVPANDEGFASGGGMEGFVPADTWDEAAQPAANGWNANDDGDAAADDAPEEGLDDAMDAGDMQPTNANANDDAAHDGDKGAHQGNGAAAGLAANGGMDSDDDGDLGQMQMPKGTKDAPPPKLTEIVIDQGRKLTLRYGLAGACSLATGIWRGDVRCPVHTFYFCFCVAAVCCCGHASSAIHALSS